MVVQVDLNCDLGESFGAYRLGADAEIMPYVTSVNIACGYHAGDPSVMRQTVKLALGHQVSIGAHPGLPDLAGFGRRTMTITPQEAYEMVVYQIGALWAFTRAEGARLRHVKPHGALYNMASGSRALSEAIAEAVYRIDPELVLYGASGSELAQAGERIGLRTAHEVFADRSYEQDGTLTPRSEPGAVIHDREASVGQTIRLIKEGVVRTRQGGDIHLRADTVCLHGDTPDALASAMELRSRLEQAGITLRRVGS